MPRRRKDRLRAGACFTAIFIIIILILIIVCTVKLPERTECPKDMYRTAAVATDSPACSNIARDILHSGGSAVDSAVAALICTSVTNPQSMGLGGGVIFTIREKNGKVKIINAREATPTNYNNDLLSQCANTTGVQWVGVPGELRGYERAHQLYGRLPWKRLFEPTIRLAKQGIKVSPTLSRYLSVLKDHHTPLSRLFKHPNGTLMKEGDVVKFERLISTLQKVADLGADAFYSGDMATALIRDVEEAGGSLTEDDLKSYQVTVSEAWSVLLDKYMMFFPPPPAGGAILSFILNIMEGYQLNPGSRRDHKALMYQRYVEACKFANGLKHFIKDPKFSSDKEAHTIITANFAKRVRAMIRNNITHDAQYYNVTTQPDTQGTTHISVLDKDGIAVSVTSTINHIFGSGVLSPNTGVILNNELADFCGRTKHIHPGERPPSSMTPVVLYSHSEKHTLVIGASGGSMITTGMATALMNYLWLGKTLKDSIASSVVYVDGKNELSFEKSFDQDVIKALQRIGHTVKTRQYFFNSVNAVSKHEHNCVNAISDKRKMGGPAGY